MSLSRPNSPSIAEQLGVRRLWRTVPAVLAAFALVLLGVAAPASAVEDTSVAGTVYGPPEDGSYVPLAGATVTVHPAGSEGTVAATATTSAGGTYLVEGLAPGDYKVRFAGDASLHQPQWYGGSSFDSAYVVTIAPGTHLTFIDAYLLDATTSIAGTVRGPDSAGLPGVTVEAFDTDDPASAAASAISQADGTYLIEGLDPGDYVVRFTGDAMYAVQWYFASTSAANALTLTVDAGTHLEGIDATLAAPGFEWLNVPTPTITGTATAGGTLTAQPGTWDPVPTSFTYQWSVEGVEVAGATSADFVVPASAKGSQVTVTVTAHKAGFPNQSAVSDPLTIAGWSAAEIAEAMNLPAGITLAVTGSPGGVAVATVPITGFPREGSSFVVLSTGLAKSAALPGEPSTHLSSTLDGPNGVDDNDLSQLALQVTSFPPGSECVVMDLRFGTEEYPEYVNQGFNDLFTMESPTSSITLTAEGVQAPNNYAFDVDGDIISVDTAGLTTIAGTALDGVTPILVAAAPIPVAADGRIIITIQDRGDSILDSAVFLDKVRFGSGDVCDSNIAAPVDPLTGPVPTISGTVEQGETLTAVAGTWAPAPVELEFQWLRDGSPIPGATGPTYQVGAADEGARISVRVTAAKPGYLSVVKVSAETVPVPGAVSGTITGLVVETDGSPAAGVDVCLRKMDGGPVTVDIGVLDAGGRYTFSGVPAGTYHLLFITSSPTCGASQTGSAPYEPQYYRFQGALAAAAPLVIGTGSEDLVLEDVVLTAYGAGVAKELHAHVAPSITGTAQIGQTLTAGPASWYPAPTTVVRQWLADGIPISGATGATYTVTAAEAGKPITVRETASGPDLVTTAATSAPTAVVPFGTLTAPTPSITGTPRVGTTLTAVPGTWGPAPVTLAYQWKANGVAVPDATASTYVPTAAVLGQTITVTVTGSKAGYTAAPKTSAATTAVVAATLTAPTPTITGTAKIGATVTAVPGTWGPAPVTLGYQWKANGVAVSGATGSTYVVPASLLGKTLTVTVTGSKAGYATVAKTSAATAAITVGTLTAPTPTISGTVKVGAKLTAVPGTWGPAPVTLKYQWKADGAAISGATASTYVLPASLLGKKITVTVTGSKTSYATVSRTSAATAAVAKGTLTAPTPTISGTAKVGVKLTAVPGAWGPAPVTLKYQWRADGVAISGATASTYIVAAGLVGKKITVTVTGTKTGYTTASKTSAATVAVVKGSLTAPTPTVTGTARVGLKLTALAGTWGPAPVTLKYQWKANGTAISGATSSTLVIPASAKGKKITVTVTGSKTGYTTVSKTSASSATVG